MRFLIAESVILPFMSLLAHRAHTSALTTVAHRIRRDDLPGSAQSRATVTVDDYARAEKFLGYNTDPLVSNGPVRATLAAGRSILVPQPGRQRHASSSSSMP